MFFCVFFSTCLPANVLWTPGATWWSSLGSPWLYSTISTAGLLDYSDSALFLDQDESLRDRPLNKCYQDIRLGLCITQNQMTWG